MTQSYTVEFKIQKSYTKIIKNQGVLMIKKYILVDGKIETLAFFSYQIESELNRLGFETYMHSFYDGEEKLLDQIGTDNTILITFNCILLSDEPEYSQFIRLNIPAINILVDHPMYYHEQLISYTDNVTIICIDRFHADYVKKYYPNIRNIIFMPLAGSAPKKIVPYKDKAYDVIFTGNFTPCSYFEKYIERNGREYSNFYHEIIDDLLSDYSRPIEQVCEKHIQSEIPNATDNDVREVMSKMIFIDLYLRFYQRECVIKEIIKSGFNVRFVGRGFDALGLNSTTLMPTSFCLEETAKAKVSLNIMPGFCDGSHDRILSSMLCHTLCVTDKSRWLVENFENRENILFYDVSMPSTASRAIEYALTNPDILERISENGHKKALELHTWNSRVNEIILNIS